MTTAIGKPKFNLGQILATPGALEALEESGQNVQFFLSRHVRGDWGDVDSEDQQANDQSLLDGSRFLDSFEAQIETICLDIAFALGGRYASSGDLLGFNFSAMSQEAFERRVEDAAAMTPSRIATTKQEVV